MAVKSVDPSMKPELDEFGHPIHFVAKTFVGLHIGDYTENWAHYWKTENGTWDLEIYKTKYEDGHVREWPCKHITDKDVLDAAIKVAEDLFANSHPLDEEDQRILEEHIGELAFNDDTDKTRTN